MDIYPTLLLSLEPVDTSLDRSGIAGCIEQIGGDRYGRGARATLPGFLHCLYGLTIAVAGELLSVERAHATDIERQRARGLGPGPVHVFGHYHCARSTHGHCVRRPAGGHAHLAHGVDLTLELG